MNRPAPTALLGMILASTVPGADAAAGPASNAAADSTPNDLWDGALYSFKRPEKLVVEESTPTAAQASWMDWPERLPASPPDPVDRGSAKSVEVGPLDVVRLTFRDADGEVVPALLCRPHGSLGRLPVVIAVHGLTSNKAQVCAQVGPALSKRGFATLALDLPYHGERPGNPLALLNFSPTEKTFPLARRMVNDVRQLIDIAEAREDLDTRSGVTLVGYSMGSWVSAVVGPLDARVKSMVLMVGGAIELPAPSLLIPKIAATDPRLAIAHFAGRPLLMVNGKTDVIVRQDWANRLYAAAPEPKRQLWYDCGHFLMPEAFEATAAWVQEHRAK